jgi:hypothetical protein
MLGHTKPGNVLNLFRLSIQLPPLYSPAPFLRTPIAASIMDSDALYPSSLSSVYQPLDVLRLELQDEPAYLESDLPKDDHTLTFVSFGPIHTLTNLTSHFFSLPASSLWYTQALPEGSRIQCVPGEADDP